MSLYSESKSPFLKFERMTLIADMVWLRMSLDRNTGGGKHAGEGAFTAPTNHTESAVC